MSGQPTIFTLDTLMETLQAYKRTAVLRTALDLTVFDAFADGPLTAEQAAARLGLGGYATGVLLGALAAVGLLGADGPRYALLPGSEQLLVTSSPSYRGGGVRLIAGDTEWAELGRLTDIVRNGGTLLGLAADSPDFPYWVDFAGDQTYVARATAQRFVEAITPWAAGQESLRVLDVGCGNALPSILFARTFPAARVRALDAGPVLAEARAGAARAGVADRIEYLAGDVFEVPVEELGGPYDVVLVTNLLPMFSPERGEELLRRVGRVLRPGGRVVVVGFTVGDDPVRDHAAHMLSLLMLAWTHGGEAHGVDAYRKMLDAAGYEAPEVYPVDRLAVHVLISAKPEGPES